MFNMMNRMKYLNHTRQVSVVSAVFCRISKRLMLHLSTSSHAPAVLLIGWSGRGPNGIFFSRHFEHSSLHWCASCWFNSSKLLTTLILITIKRACFRDILCGANGYLSLTFVEQLSSSRILSF